MRESRIIAVRTGKQVIREGDAIVKIFDKDYSKSDVLNEALNQARVEETGLNIPKIREVCVRDEKWTIVMDYIPGKTLDRLMQENPDRLDEYLDKFVDLQLEMQAKKAPNLNKLKDKMHRKIDESKLGKSNKYDLQTRLDGMPTHTKLCHGDYNPSNIIVGEDGKYYIIDWSHATQGNASADAARTYLLFVLDNKKDVAEKYMNLFCSKSGTDRKYVNGWLPIVAASQSVKGRKDEKEILSIWAGVVDFE